MSHCRQYGTAAQKHTAEIDRHQPVPFVGFDGFDPAAVHRHDGEHRRVVDQDIDAAETLEGACGHFLGRRFVRNIRGQRQRRRAEIFANLCDGALGGGPIDVGDDNTGATFCKSETVGFADTMRAAGDDDDFVSESVNHFDGIM